jgi:hypothetical protein
MFRVDGEPGARVTRRLERFVLGLVMAVAAFVLDRRLRRAQHTDVSDE